MRYNAESLDFMETAYYADSAMIERGTARNYETPFL